MIKEILRFFEEIFKILSKLLRNFREKFREFWKYAFVRGSWGGFPEASEIIKKLVEK